ncbi:MAG: polyphosphate kinase 1 [Chloroflexota bacterium]
MNGAQPSQSIPEFREAADGHPLVPPGMFINRELSWLEFNRRVLEEGQDAAAPLLERIRFAAIFSSNLNEFYMIRVAGVKRKIAAGIGEPGPDGRTPAEQLAAIRALSQTLMDDQATLWRTELTPALAAAGIEIVAHDQLDARARALLGDRFVRDIFPILTPQAIDRGRRFPHVSNRSLNLIVSMHLPAGPRFARIKIPATLPRLLPVPDSGEDGQPGPLRFTWLEQVVAAHLDRLFLGAEIIESHPFHVTRDSDITLDEHDDDDEGDLMISMRESIAQRAFGRVVRLMTDRSMPAGIRDWLVEHLYADDSDLYVVDGPLAMEDLFELAAIDRPDLKDAPFVPAPVPGLSPAARGEPPDVFAAIRERDILVHHPYQTFEAVADFVRAASTDPDVVAIKQTLYRIGRDSPLIPALVAARDDDTQVAVLVELKARFDEENNITWAEQLERHGVHVAYGLTGLKTHCKVTLVVRREADGLRRYVHLATGNYNAGTARVYEDLGMLSAREDLGSDATDLFNVLTGFAIKDEFRTLWVAPHHLRDRLMAAIDREIAAHREDGGGRLIFKVNSLVDRHLVRQLYRASQAGVKVDLIVRGACCLRPGVPGWSENIRVISLVGRFLEHSRIFVFGAGGRNELHLGSADLMERNLDRRVEVIFPVEDADIRRHIVEEVLPAYFRDTVNARELLADGSWSPVRPARGEDPFDVQAWMLGYYQHLAAGAGPRPTA